MFRAKCRLMSLGVVLVCLQAPHGLAQDVWTLTSADFAEQRVAVVSIGDDGVKVRPAAGPPRTLAWDDVLELNRGLARSAGTGSGMMLELIGGDRLAGEPDRLADELLDWVSPWGVERIPLAQVRSIVTPTGTAAGDPGTQDAVHLRNGDQLRGVIESIDRQGVRVNVGGDVATLTWDAISAVRFAQLASRQPSPRRTFRVLLAGDSRLTVDRVATVGDQLELLSSGGKRSVPIASVLAIEQLNGPVMWLTALTPDQTLYQPYFAQVSLPPRADQTFSGQPIRLGDRLARAGISVASRSRLVYRLPAGYAGFRTIFAIDGNLPYANCVVRVLLDDRVAYENEQVTAAMPPQLLTLPLGGASILTIEVDYGKTLDVQDRVIFFEPALLRRLPATRPSE